MGMKLNATLDLDVIAIEAQDQLAILIELVAPQQEAARRRPPGTLQVVLDRSGSMEGGSLEAAKTGLDDVAVRIA